MADEIYPILVTPKPLEEKAKNYTGYLVWLAISPKIDSGVDCNASIVVRPYRILSDGSIDVAPERMAKHFHLGSLVEARASGGTKLSRFIDKLMVIIREELQAE